MKEKWKAYLKNMKREQLVVYGLLLILLVVIALPVKKSDKKAAKEETVVKDEGQIGKNVGNSQVEVMEQQLENALSKVDGVGQVQVVITLESSNQKVVEKDRPSSESTQNQTGEDGRSSNSSSGSTEESTVYEKDSDGTQVLIRIINIPGYRNHNRQCCNDYLIFLKQFFLQNSILLLFHFHYFNFMGFYPK